MAVMAAYAAGEVGHCVAGKAAPSALERVKGKSNKSRLRRASFSLFSFLFSLSSFLFPLSSFQATQWPTSPAA
jgi:hypothetical protein